MGKIGRNKPCSCGSGKKYKNCHLNVEENGSPSMWENSNSIKKRYNTKVCLAPPNILNPCNGKIINAHTVSNRASLKYIAEEGHVLGHKKSNQLSHQLSLGKIGIAKASTFLGFCTKHDGELFSSFETNPFDGNPEQCLAMAFRIASRELYSKNAANDLMPILNARIGAEEHAKTQKDLATAISKNNHAYISSLIITFDGVLPIMLAGAFTPPLDFEGAKLFDVDDREKFYHPLFITTVGTINGSAMIISCTNQESNPCSIILDQIENLNRENMSSILVEYGLKFIENFYIKPSWYDGLNAPAKQRLRSLINYGAHLSGSCVNLDVGNTFATMLPTVASIERK